MNLKTIIAKVVSWFKGEVSTVEQKAVTVVQKIEGDEAAFRAIVAGLITPAHISTEAPMSTPTTAAAPAAQATPVNQVNTAVQIALALKAIDASLSVEVVQAATNAALGALYPTAA